jgi:hypothetical protein
LETVPHTDTVARLLERLPAADLEQILLDTARRLLRHRKFAHGMVNHRYGVAMDGPLHWSRDTPWADEALHKHAGEHARYQA